MSSDIAPSSLRIRTVNFAPVQNDKPATAAKIKLEIEQAGRDGCDLLVLPEMALQGFEKCEACLSLGHACDRHLATGELIEGPLMQGLIDAVVAQEGLYAVIGFGELDPIKPFLYNAAAVIGPEGLLGTTRKLGVGSGGRGPSNWEDAFSPGSEITVYDTRFGKMGVGICYDMWINPEIARIMVLKGANLLAIPTATVATTIGGDIEAMVFTRARENGVFVANANLMKGYIGMEETESTQYFSHSYVAGPDFPRMARIWGKTDDPFGTTTVDVNFAQESILRLAEARGVDGTRKNITAIVAQEYKALSDAL